MICIENDFSAFDILEIGFEVPLRWQFHLNLNYVLTLEVLEIGFEVPLRLLFHLNSNDFVTFEILEIGFEVPLRISSNRQKRAAFVMKNCMRLLDDAKKARG